MTPRMFKRLPTVLHEHLSFPIMNDTGRPLVPFGNSGSHLEYQPVDDDRPDLDCGGRSREGRHVLLCQLKHFPHSSNLGKDLDSKEAEE